ncbi:hypothetical protein [Planotetraspora mira]|jgi:hypothetical protein|uniref:Uncharacterized protein n=1 Tax=Planotetraspora mira TaxID=58121 RepID=A0A8J3TTL5_9ACTN|nr:hypothetical protein [Planotetraspora mira]GII31906.1 hypothetical protein Pmi06nite_53480 [Planotetraspora mira]
MTEPTSSAGSFRFFPAPWPDAGAGMWANDLEEHLVALACERGFQPSHATKSELELVHAGRHRIVYINRKRLRVQIIAVIVPPWSEVDELRTIPGVSSRGDFFHSSNLRTFPRRIHDGKSEIPYGYSMVCADVGAYGRVLDQS